MFEEKWLEIDEGRAGGGCWGKASRVRVLLCGEEKG